MRRLAREHIMVVFGLGGITIAYYLGGWGTAWAFWAGIATMWLGMTIHRRL